MRTKSSESSIHLILEGDVDHPSPKDRGEIQRAIEDLKPACDGKIVFQSDKKSGYKTLHITCKDIPTLENK